MIKMSVFNKTNDVLTVDTFKNVFQRRSSEVLKPDVPEFGTFQKYMLHCQYSVTFWAETGMVESGIEQRQRGGWPLPTDC